MQVFFDFLIVQTTQYTDDILHAKTLTGTIHGGKHFLCINQPIVFFWRIETNIAIITWCLAIFAEVIQQNQTATGLAFGKFTNSFQFMLFNVTLRAFRLL